MTRAAVHLHHGFHAHRAPEPERKERDWGSLASGKRLKKHMKEGENSLVHYIYIYIIYIYITSGKN